MKDLKESQPCPFCGAGAAISGSEDHGFYDNAKGRGWMGSGVFWINMKCPLHTEKREE